jgi:hypothetical protein
MAFRQNGTRINGGAVAGGVETKNPAGAGLFSKLPSEIADYSRKSAPFKSPMRAATVRSGQCGGAKDRYRMP